MSAFGEALVGFVVGLLLGSAAMYPLGLLLLWVITDRWCWPWMLPRRWQ